MNFKYECKRFQRNHQMVNSSSHKILNFQAESRDISNIGSPQLDNSIDGISDKINRKMDISFIDTVNIFERLDQLQGAIEFQRKERFHQYNRLSKLVKEMECKHSSIIYNSQIRYCKSPPKPGIFSSASTNSLLRKVCPKSNMACKMGKQNYQGKTPRNQEFFININLLKSQREDQNQLLPSPYQNPEKADSHSSPQVFSPQILQPHFQKFSQQFSQQITQSFACMSQKLKSELSLDYNSLKQQVKKLMNENIMYIDDVIKNNNAIIDKELISVQHNEEELGRNLQFCFNQLSNIGLQVKEIGEEVKKEAELRNNGGTVGGQQRVERLEEEVWGIGRRAEVCEGQGEFLKQKIEFLVGKFQDFIGHYEFQTNDFRQKIENCRLKNDQSIKQFKDKLQKYTNSSHGDHTLQLELKLKELQKYLQSRFQQANKQINDTRASCQNSLVTYVNQINGKVQDIERNLASLSVQPRLQQLSARLTHQSQQISNLETSFQSTNSTFSQKIHQLLQLFMSKLQALQKDRISLSQLQKLKQQFLQGQKQCQKSLQAQKQKQRELIFRNIEDRLNNKAQLIKISSTKEMQISCQKIQGRLCEIIEHHIGNVESFVRKINERENEIYRKFVMEGGVRIWANGNGHSGSNGEKNLPNESAVTAKTTDSYGIRDGRIGNF